MNMKETMDQELAEAIATLEKANSALSRIFNTQEGEGDIDPREALFNRYLMEGDE